MFLRFIVQPSLFIKPNQFDCEDQGQSVLPFSVRCITFKMKTEVREEGIIIYCNPFVLSIV